MIQKCQGMLWKHLPGTEVCPFTPFLFYIQVLTFMQLVFRSESTRYSWNHAASLSLLHDRAGRRERVLRNLISWRKQNRPLQASPSGAQNHDPLRPFLSRHRIPPTGVEILSISTKTTVPPTHRKRNALVLGIRRT